MGTFNILVDILFQVLLDVQDTYRTVDSCSRPRGVQEALLDLMFQNLVDYSLLYFLQSPVPVSLMGKFCLQGNVALKISWQLRDRCLVCELITTQASYVSFQLTSA